MTTKAREALNRIHAILNGEEWDSDTTSAIAEVIVRFGFVIYDPNIDDEGVANAPLPPDTDPAAEYTFEHMEAGACMWEHVQERIRRHKGGVNPWLEYREAYGIAQLRGIVLTHAPRLEAAYVAAVANKYDKAFDLDFVPKYMEEHITRILT